MPVTQCRFFNGYKPCGQNQKCDEGCPSKDIPQLRLLIIHLGAMGAVVRATSLLAAIKRKFPSSHLTWVTEKPMHQLLEKHPRVDRVLTTSNDDQLVLSVLEFDIAFVIDKSLPAMGLLAKTHADLVYGFVADARSGAILPASPAAEELWHLGLDNHQKFFVNQKPETQLQVEALEVGPFRRDEYDLPLLPAEKIEIQRRHALWTLGPSAPVIGLNTGCGPLMPAKKWSVEFHRIFLQQLLDQGHRNLVLLGGPEDEERNAQIGEGLAVIQSSTRKGIRDGLQSIAACDVIFTGDSFGMHLAIAMRRFVIAWFGPSCAHEIDLYDRGVKVMASVRCSPCWKRHCANTQMCYDHVNTDNLIEALAQGQHWWMQQNQKALQQPEISV